MIKGKITDIQQNFSYRFIKLQVTSGDLAPLEELKDKELEITFKEHKKHRSLDANALLWACIGDIAKATKQRNDDIYLDLLRNYGEFTYVCVKPEALGEFMKAWKYVDVLPEHMQGAQGISLKIYFGSSTYDTKQFSRLIDGVMEEMKELNIQRPLPETWEQALKIRSKKHE